MALIMSFETSVCDMARATVFYCCCISLFFTIFAASYMKYKISHDKIELKIIYNGS